MTTTTASGGCISVGNLIAGNVGAVRRRRSSGHAADAASTDAAVDVATATTTDVIACIDIIFTGRGRGAAAGGNTTCPTDRTIERAINVASMATGDVTVGPGVGRSARGIARGRRRGACGRASVAAKCRTVAVATVAAGDRSVTVSLVTADRCGSAAGRRCSASGGPTGATVAAVDRSP